MTAVLVLTCQPQSEKGEGSKKNTGSVFYYLEVGRFVGFYSEE